MLKRGRVIGPWSLAIHWSFWFAHWSFNRERLKPNRLRPPRELAEFSPGPLDIREMPAIPGIDLRDPRDPLDDRCPHDHPLGSRSIAPGSIIPTCSANSIIRSG